MPIDEPPKNASDSENNTGSIPQDATTRRALTRMQERKYFDSGDYALSKASNSGTASPNHQSSLTMVGRLHPSPERIPRSSSQYSLDGISQLTVPPNCGSPMKSHVISSENLSPVGGDNLTDGSEDEFGMEDVVLTGDGTIPSHGKGGGLAK